MAEVKIVDRIYGLGDPHYPERVVKPNADGSLNVVGTFAPAPTTFQSAGNGEYNLAVAGAAVALTPPATATAAQITVTGANIRYRDDGTNPTAAVGMPVFQGTSWLYIGPLSALRFIAQAGNAVLDVSYYK